MKPALKNNQNSTLSEVASEHGEYCLDECVQRPHFFGQEVLLVEDNLVNQQIALELLEEVGLAVTLAVNGKEAVEKVYACTSVPAFALVLMDVEMPEMDGMQASKLIRKDVRQEKMPIIAMTAHASEQVEQAFLDAGMTGYLPKPVNVQQLDGVLMKYLVQAPSSTELQPVHGKDVSSSIPAGLDGFSVESALARLNNNQKLYRTLLIRFWENYAQDEGRARKCFDERDIAGLQRFSHTIKGLAAGMGHARLQEDAASLEKECAVFASTDDSAQKQPCGLERLAHKIEHFSEALHAALTALQQTFGHSLQEKAHVDQTADFSGLEQELARLQAFLEGDDAEAVGVYDAISGQLTALDPSLNSRCAKAMRHFDFDTALDILASFREALQFRLTGGEAALPEE